VAHEGALRRPKRARTRLEVASSGFHRRGRHGLASEGRSLEAGFVEDLAAWEAHAARTGRETRWHPRAQDARRAVHLEVFDRVAVEE